MIVKTISETIGKTPVVRLNKIASGLVADIYLKCEFMNPLSSLKDRVALAMIEKAEKEGHIRPGSIIVEPTSGNTGISLAYICAERGYELILTMPDSMSLERQVLLSMLGAKLELTPGCEAMRGAIRKAEEIMKKIGSKAFMPNQFNNPANAEAHRKTTAVEIWEDFNGDIDAFVMGVGTGGTLTGVAEEIKRRNPKFKAVAVEPASSAILSGGSPGAHAIQGIGAGFIPGILNMDVVDDIIPVKDSMAIKMANQLAEQEGILVGISTGANVWAAMELAKRPEMKGKKIVTLACSGGERYISSPLAERIRDSLSSKA